MSYSDTLFKRGRFIVLCAHQRSGTTALQHALDSTATIENFGEIFHHNGTNSVANYFSFLRDSEECLRCVAYPSVQQRRVLLQSYMRHLDTLGTKTRILLDIKYNSWHHFEPIWSTLLAEPFMLEQMKTHNVPIIHVRRANLFLQYVSLKFADSIKQYHYAKTDTTAHTHDLKLQIDVKDCLSQLYLAKGTQNLFSAFLQNYGNVVDLAYEELYNGTQVSQCATNRLRAVLEFSETSLRTDLIKTPQQAVTTIINREEVIAAFVGTPFEKMAADGFDGVSPAILADPKVPL